jgi:hypothetical protein
MRWACGVAANLLAGNTPAVLGLQWIGFAHAVRQIMLAPVYGQPKTGPLREEPPDAAAAAAAALRQGIKLLIPGSFRSEAQP